MFSVFHTSLQINHMRFRSVSQWERKWPSQTAQKLESSSILGWKLNTDSPFLLSVEKNCLERICQRELLLCFSTSALSHRDHLKNPNIAQVQFLGYTFDSCNIKRERKSSNGIQIRFL